MLPARAPDVAADLASSWRNRRRNAARCRLIRRQKRSAVAEPPGRSTQHRSSQPSRPSLPGRRTTVTRLRRCLATQTAVSHMSCVFHSGGWAVRGGLAVGRFGRFGGSGRFGHLLLFRGRVRAVQRGERFRCTRARYIRGEAGAHIRVMRPGSIGGSSDSALRSGYCVPGQPVWVDTSVSLASQRDVAAAIRSPQDLLKIGHSTRCDVVAASGRLLLHAISAGRLRLLNGRDRGLPHPLERIITG